MPPSPAAPESNDYANDQPLGLTVHSMPISQGLQADAAQRTRLGRWKMFLVLLICASPVVASYTAYYWLRPEARRNYGELIEPQRDLPNATARTLQGKAVPLSSLKAQWLLISVASGACDTRCQQHLYFQRQLREGLGKNKDRMDWVWLISDEAPVPSNLLPALKDATVLRVPADVLAQWLQPQAGHTLSEHLYVVDPLGHWMMRFPAGVNLETASKIKRDLDHLMRGSAGWDKEGR